MTVSISKHKLTDLLIEYRDDTAALHTIAIAVATGGRLSRDRRGKLALLLPGKRNVGLGS